jgi:hypothetical protein
MIDCGLTTADADRGRHPGFSSFDVLAGGPGSLARRSGGKMTPALMELVREL